MHPLTNYKLLDDIAMEIAQNLKIQRQQDLLAYMWKPCMNDLDTMFTDATCYESDMRYPTNPEILWEGPEPEKRMFGNKEMNNYLIAKNERSIFRVPPSEGSASNTDLT